MKCLIASLLLTVVGATSALAQDPFEGAFPQAQNQPSVPAWSVQDPRYDTPKQAVHRKAAWKAAQRRERLEAMKRIGYSPSRPPASPVPFMTSSRPWIIVAPAYGPFGVVYYSR